ncbi:MAG: AhpC/TSA family protein [Chitinophagaceae bacterium]|nr:MAG: AhpC/TSA family protein [Chitinophagaceae bacterium]
MHKISILLLFVAMSTCCFSQNRTKTFEIIGSVSGFKDSSYIKLYDFSTGSNVFMDSTEIINGKFAFNGSMKKNYQQVGIITPDFKNSKIFWLEDTVIHFYAEKGKFRNAIISGSSMQVEENQLDSIISKNPQQAKEKYFAYIRNHPNSIISGYVLKMWSKVWGKNTSKLLYDILSKEVKQSNYGKDVKDYILLNKDIKVGDKFVDFTLPDINGKRISLSDYKGKYVLLDFWGSWCEPCREENPKLVKIYKDFKSKGFDILGVSIETKKKEWLNAVSHDNITWQDVSDLKGDNNKAVLIYGIYRYPSNFLIDPNGIIIAKNLSMDALMAKLGEILK